MDKVMIWLWTDWSSLPTRWRVPEEKRETGMQQHKRYQLVYIREIKEDPVLYLHESVRVKGE